MPGVLGNKVWFQKTHPKEVRYGNFRGERPKNRAFLSLVTGWHFFSSPVKGIESLNQNWNFQQDWVKGFETKKEILMFSGTTPYGRAGDKGRNHNTCYG